MTARTGHRLRARVVAAAGFGLGVFAFVVASCSTTRTAVSPVSTTTTTMLAATAATTPPTCGNPVASFAPDGPLPAPTALPPGSTMARIRARGRLIVGVSADTLLFGFRNPATGKLEGFDVDMVHEVARAILGDPDKIQYRVVTYAQRIPALTSGSVDIVADVMTINCARWKQVSFSAEYYRAGQKVLVRTDSKAADIDDLDGRKVCAAQGSTNIEELAKYPKVVVVPVPDISDCLVLFQQSRVDAITGDDTVLAGFVAQDPYAKVVGRAFTTEPYGLAIAKSHPDLVRFVNALLERMRTDGTWTSLDEKWLKPAAPEAQPKPVYGRQP